MFLASPCSCFCPIQWTQMLSRKWGCCWSSADRRCSNYIWAGLAGFFHLVEETGLNPGLNRPGRNRFLPPEVEETGQNWKKAWNAWLSEYFPLQEAVILNTYETTAKNVLDTNTLLLFTCSFHGKWNKKLWWLPGRNKFFPLEVEETVIKNFESLKWINM